MPSREKTALPRISRSLDSIRADLFSFVDVVQQDFAAKGWLPVCLNLNKGVVRGLLEITAWSWWQIYSFMQTLLAEVAPYHATGSWLDLHANGVALRRREATKSLHRVRFYRAENAAARNVNIPAQRIVRTLPDGAGAVYRYSTQADAVLVSETNFVDVQVEAEDYGAATNVTAGQICELVTPVVGIAAVTNVPDSLVREGAGAERDDQLQERYALQWQANNGCTKYAYMAWALSVPGVTSVSILDRHPRGQGTVDIVVRGADVLPTAGLLEKVREAIAPHVPINDDWLVKGPLPVPVAIKATVEMVSGDPEQIRATVERRLRALFAETSPLNDVKALQIGQDVTVDLLTHTVMAVAGVKRVSWLAPLDDVAVSAAGVARLESLNLETIMASEA